MREEKYGFIYIWRDRKNNRYYIGSHWGHSDDGYICSSNWMRMAHKRRPEDFKRKIISIIRTNRQDLLAEEQRWLDFIKDKELSKRYYNHRKNVLFDVWWMDPERAATVKERISRSHKGKTQSKETRFKISKFQKGRHRSKETRGKIRETLLGRPRSEDTRRKISEAQKGRPAWNKGKTSSRETRHKIKEARLRQVISEETRRKLSKIHRGLKHSEETRRKMSESARSRYRCLNG